VFVGCTASNGTWLEAQDSLVYTRTVVALGWSWTPEGGSEINTRMYIKR